MTLSTGDRAKFNAHELAEHIASLTFYPGIAPPRATYDELSGSGLLTEIGSTSVRTAVARYHSMHNAWLSDFTEAGPLDDLLGHSITCGT